MKYNQGDKVKCVTSNTHRNSIRLGEIYTVSRVSTINREQFVEVEGIDEKFASYRFELVSSTYTIEKHVSEALKFVGRDIKGSDFQWEVERIVIVHRDDINLSMSCKRYFKDNVDDFCVCVGNGEHAHAPYSSVKLIPECIIVDKVGDYSVKVHKDFIEVGCQSIPWSKVEELVKAHEKLK